MPARRIPLLFLRGGLVVEPDGGGWLPQASEEASVAFARKLYAMGEELYLIDLDGQFNGAANLALIQLMGRRQVFPWIDAGCRKPEDVMDVLFAGGDAITMQLRHLEPAAMEEVSGLSEASLYIGFTAVQRGLEKGLVARDVLDLVARVGATGVVLYETEATDLHAAENVAFDIQRAGVPVAWVSRPGSSNAHRAAESTRFAHYIGTDVRP